MLTNSTLTLKAAFLLHFAGVQSFTAREAFEWYANSKGGAAAAYRPNLYNQILLPLIAEGKVVKLTKGVYRVQNTDANDDWQIYIQSKLGH